MTNSVYTTGLLAVIGAGSVLMVSLMAAMDGALSGLMGGMMGAMLGVMAPDRARSIMEAGAWVVSAASALLLLVIAQEVGSEYFREKFEALDLRRQPRYALVAAAAVALLALSSFFSDASLPGNGTAHPGHQTQAIQEGRATPNPSELTVTATEFKFDRQVITVAAEERVRLRLVNAGAAGHDLTIPDQNVYVQADRRTSSVTEFIPQKPGVYRAFCSYPGHSEKGMRLEVIVK